jgi:hypothetical protein
VSVAADGGGGAASVRLAPLVGRALDGTPWRLPDDLPAARTLVLLAYRQRHQRDVDAWIALAVALGVPPTPRGERRPMATAVIEVPTLGRRWLPARRFIDGGMATGIADPDVLARTVTAYADPVAHRAACGFADGEGDDGGEAMRALVAAPDGTVSFHAVGPPGPGARTALAAALGLR